MLSGEQYVHFMSAEIDRWYIKKKRDGHYSWFMPQHKGIKFKSFAK